MAKRATVFDEETARILVTIARLYKQTGFVTGMGRGISALLEDPPVPYYVHNDSGEEIPPYACMQVTGTEEIGGQNYLLVDKPADTTGDAGSFLFNNHRAIADNEEGIAQFGPVVRAFKNTGTVTAGEHWLPVANQWYIAQDDGGPFVAAGADDIDDDVLKVFTNTPGSGGKIYAFQITSTRTGSNPAYWTATILDPTDQSTVLATGVTLWGNYLMFDDLTTNDNGICGKYGADFVIVNAPCGA